MLSKLQKVAKGDPEPEDLEMGKSDSDCSGGSCDSQPELPQEDSEPPKSDKSANAITVIMILLGITACLVGGMWLCYRYKNHQATNKKQDLLHTATVEGDVSGSNDTEPEDRGLVIPDNVPHHELELEVRKQLVTDKYTKLYAELDATYGTDTDLKAEEERQRNVRNEKYFFLDKKHKKRKKKETLEKDMIFEMRRENINPEEYLVSYETLEKDILSQNTPSHIRLTGPGEAICHGGGNFSNPVGNNWCKKAHYALYELQTDATRPHKEHSFMPPVNDPTASHKAKYRDGKVWYKTDCRWQIHWCDHKNLTKMYDPYFKNADERIFQSVSQGRKVHGSLDS